jgi:hypothetical protein
MSFYRSPLHLVILGVALCVGATALAPSAQAQSCSDSLSVHSSYPADGATGVPINTPVFVWGPELTVPDFDITLESSNGQAVMIDVRYAEGGGGLFVDPFLGLAPSTTYDLTVTPNAGGGAWSASFTTGTSTATPVQLEAPDVTVSVLNQDKGSCGTVSAICVNGSVPERMTLEVLVGEDVVSLGGGRPVPVFLPNSGSVASNGCVDVRVREPGGLLSPTTRACGAALARFELADDAAAPTSCTPYPNTIADDADDDLDSDDSDSDSESADSGGCALGASGAAPSAGGLLLGLSTLLVARQRRRARR